MQIVEFNNFVMLDKGINCTGHIFAHHDMGCGICLCRRMVKWLLLILLVAWKVKKIAK